jgi:aminomethyltransferase
MGEIEIAGKNAEAAVQRIACSDPAKLKAGQAQYSGLLTPDGTFLDDMIIYRMAPSHFLIVVNASNTAKDFAWISEQIKPVGDVAAIDSSSRYALIALAGPASREVLQPLTGVELTEIAAFGFANGEVANARTTIARTGYTGEDGFEIVVPAKRVVEVWSALVAAGVRPCGLGARDTLRLEAGMNLYGQDMDERTSPLDAGLAWTVDLASPRDFVGKAALLAAPPTRQLAGLVLLDGGGVLRAHQKVHTAHGAGEVTSGTFGPSIARSIALARLPAAVAVGDDVEVEVRDKRLRARVVKPPFVRNGAIKVALA